MYIDFYSIYTHDDMQLYTTSHYTMYNAHTIHTYIHIILYIHIITYYTHIYTSKLSMQPILLFL